MKKIIAILLVILSFKQINAKSIGQYTGLEIPRFVSTKTTDSNLRVGADITYPIIVRYVQKNIPLKIIDEHKNWRKIEDFEGQHEQINFNVLGMTCSHCKESVEGAVHSVPGVEKSTVDLLSGKVQVEGKNIDKSAMIKRIVSKGFSIKA